MVKSHCFYYQLINHKIKKITRFNLICPLLQKKMTLETFIPTSRGARWGARGAIAPPKIKIPSIFYV